MTRLCFLLAVALLPSSILCQIQTPSPQVPCETYDVDGSHYNVGEKDACLMNSQTTIDSPTTYILSQGKDDTVGALILQNNYNVKFLPYRIDSNFPELEVINADGCLIKWIVKDNFVFLSKLKRISLNSNQIRKIDDDTFSGLNALEFVSLRNNMIKYINGNAFYGLSNLQEVNLYSNICLSKDFTGEQIATLRETVAEKCGYAALK